MQLLFRSSFQIDHCLFNFNNWFKFLSATHSLWLKLRKYSSNYSVRINSQSKCGTFHVMFKSTEYWVSLVQFEQSQWIANLTNKKKLSALFYDFCFIHFQWQRQSQKLIKLFSKLDEIFATKMKQFYGYYYCCCCEWINDDIPRSIVLIKKKRAETNCI